MNRSIELARTYNTGEKDTFQAEEYKNTRNAQSIIARQSKEGLWTGYHNLSVPRKDTDSMEENLRRLEILGYTINDEPIRKTIHFLEDNLQGKVPIIEKNGQQLNQDFFTDLINAAWIRRFTEECQEANLIAQQWTDLYTYAFITGTFDKKRYEEKFRLLFDADPFRWAAQKQRNFYEVSILADQLDEKTEEAFIDYLLHSPEGIYYMYQAQLSELPTEFKQNITVKYLSTIYLLLKYKRSRGKFSFVIDWIMENQDQPGIWDLGKKAKDGIIFPLSDDWKSDENRIKDCTWFIKRILERYHS